MRGESPASSEAGYSFFGAVSSLTDVVRQLVAGKGFLFADRGETDMRGFDEPVRLYEVRWQ